MMFFLFVTTSTSSATSFFLFLHFFTFMFVFLLLLSSILWVISRSLLFLFLSLWVISLISFTMSWWRVIIIRIWFTFIRWMTFLYFFYCLLSFRLRMPTFFLLLETFFVIGFVIFIWFWWMLVLSFVCKHFHCVLIFLIKILSYLLDDTEKRVISWLLPFLIFNIHLGDKFNKGIFHFSGCTCVNIHDKIFHKVLSIMKIFWCFIIDKPGIMKFVESSKVHWNLVIKSHKFWRFVEVSKMLIMIYDLDESFD